jgi:RNA polymerase sigma-70 factor, ECF subfamily
MQALSAQVVQQSNALTDEQVIERILSGETALFEILMRRYNERMFRVARAIVGDETEAEDVMQQAYVNAYTNLRQFAGKARFSTWLTRIAVNEALYRMRRRAKYDLSVDEPSNVEPLMADVSHPNPEQETSSGVLRALLEWAIDRLPDGTRAVFMLREVEGSSTADVAESLGVSEEVVKTRLSRAKRALRRVVSERIGASAPDVFRFYRPRCDRIVDRVLSDIEMLA